MLLRERAIKDLSQLSDKDFFSEVSVGLKCILENAASIQRDAKLLGEHDRLHGCRILCLIAGEEAAKFFILLDAIRCPRVPHDQFARQLSRFHDHLSKGIYADICGMRPASFGEIATYVERERRDYYLDGPNDIDWIFRNSILQGREETMYVDYVETDEGHSWLTPLGIDFAPMTELPGLRIASALDELGFTTPEALAVIAKQWRSAPMTDDFHWSHLRELNIKTMEDLASRRLLHDEPSEVSQVVIDEWLFPLYSLDMTPIRVNKNELREIQKRWTPGW